MDSVAFGGGGVGDSPAGAGVSVVSALIDGPSPDNVEISVVAGKLVMTWSTAEYLFASVTLGTLPVTNYSGKSPLLLGDARAGSNIIDVLDVQKFTKTVSATDQSLTFDQGSVWYTWSNGGYFTLTITRQSTESDVQTMSVTDISEVSVGVRSIKVGDYLAGTWRTSGSFDDVTQVFCFDNVQFSPETNLVTWEGASGVHVVVEKGGNVIVETDVNDGNEYLLQQPGGTYKVSLSAYGCATKSMTVNVWSCPQNAEFRTSTTGLLTAVTLYWDSGITFKYKLTDAWGIVLWSVDITPNMSSVTIGLSATALGAWYDVQN